MTIHPEKQTPRRGLTRVHSNILIIEDDPDTSDIIARTLIKQGYGARVVSSRDEALHVMNRYLYDVIVMDLYMPGLSADEFVHTVREHNARSQFVLITAIESVAEQAQRLGIHRWVGKPFDPSELLGAITDGANR